MGLRIQKVKKAIILLHKADVAELVDALDSGSSGRKPVEVRVLLSAPLSRYTQITSNFLYNLLYILNTDKHPCRFL